MQENIVVNSDYTADKKQKSYFSRIAKHLKSQRWRINNLYTIVDDKGKERKFKMRLAQKILYLGMWYLNIILKSRQHGITTFICLFFLDTCMFNSNTHACIIAHNKDDAMDFFTKKIMFAYNNLHPLLRENIVAQKSSTKELTFANGSSIRVTTSGRSGTYQLIHISEFGKICAKYPHKAEEIITGTLNAIHPGQIAFIESTAEGREGKFYEMVEAARKAHDSGASLTKLDWKYFFFGWMDNPLNKLSRVEALRVPITKRFIDYFDKVESVLKRPIPIELKAWYVKKEETQGELMLREHPSTPEEAFQKSTKGVYYATQFTFLRKNDRITQVPYNPNYRVDTWWDLGFNDTNAIWFIQTVGNMIHVINHYEQYGEGLAHYSEYLKGLQDELGYKYGRHFAPHDIGNHDYSIGRTRQSYASDYGLKLYKVDRLSIDSGIEAVRKLLPYCVFDIVLCDKGIRAMEAYRKEWDEKKATYRDHPYHDWASNTADAFRTGAVVHPFTKVNFKRQGSLLIPVQGAPSPKGWAA